MPSLRLTARRAGRIATRLATITVHAFTAGTLRVETTGLTDQKFVGAGVTAAKTVEITTIARGTVTIIKAVGSTGTRFTGIGVAFISKSPWLACAIARAILSADRVTAAASSRTTFSRRVVLLTGTRTITFTVESAS